VRAAESAAEARFAVFVRAHSPQLLRAAWVLTGDWPGAEDLVQVAFERTWPRWQRLDNDARRTAYLRRVMTAAFLRGAKRRWSGELASAELPEPSGAEARGDIEVTRMSVHAAIAALPPQQRAAVVLRYLLDLSEADTAAALGVTTGTVKSTTSRALSALRSRPDLSGLLVEGTS
jgi:RNA polymerase sigma-70 factor (sigma-E family)